MLAPKKQISYIQAQSSAISAPMLFYLIVLYILLGVGECQKLDYKVYNLASALQLFKARWIRTIRSHQEGYSSNNLTYGEVCRINADWYRGEVPGFAGVRGTINKWQSIIVAEILKEDGSLLTEQIQDYAFIYDCENECTLRLHENSYTNKLGLHPLKVRPVIDGSNMHLNMEYANITWTTSGDEFYRRTNLNPGPPYCTYRSAPLDGPGNNDYLHTHYWRHSKVSLENALGPAIKYIEISLLMLRSP